MFAFPFLCTESAAKSPTLTRAVGGARTAANGRSTTDVRRRQRPLPVRPSAVRRLTMHRRLHRLPSTRYRRHRTVTSAQHNYDALTLCCHRIRLIFGPVAVWRRSAAYISIPFSTTPVASMVHRDNSSLYYILLC